MAEIPNVNQQAPQRPVYTNQAADFATGAGVSQKTTEVVRDVAAILGGRGVTVNTVADNSTVGETGKPTGATGIPVLDNPADPKAIEANLEKLLAYLQLDNDERQAELAKDRIETNKNSLEIEHKERKAKINESLKKMEDAAKARKASRFLSWLGAIFSVVAAIVTTVVTMGTAAVFAWAGAAVAITSLVMNETGAMDDLVEALAKHLQETYGMNSEKSKLASSLIINLSLILIGGGLSVGGMVSGAVTAAKAAADTISAVAKSVQTAVAVVGTGLTVANIATGATTTALGYKADMAQADVQEVEKIMQELKRRLEESEEELNAIIEALQNAIGQIADLIASQTDTESEIAAKISQMA